MGFLGALKVDAMKTSGKIIHCLATSLSRILWEKIIDVPIFTTLWMEMRFDQHTHTHTHANTNLLFN